MSKPNVYGYSTQMNPKLKNLLKSYNPSDVSELTAIRNRKPIWSQNTIRKMNSAVHEQDTFSSAEVTSVVSVVAFVLVFLFVLSSL